MRINGLLGGGIVALLLTSSVASAAGVCYLDMVSGHPTENCDADVPAEQRSAIFSAVQTCSRQGLGVMTGSPVYSASDVNCVSKTTASSDPSGSGSGGSSTGASGGTPAGFGNSGSMGTPAATAAATGGANANNHRRSWAEMHPVTAAARTPATASQRLPRAGAATRAAKAERPTISQYKAAKAAPTTTPVKAAATKSPATTSRTRPQHPPFGQHRAPRTGKPIKKTGVT
ncbi:MAG TPA: hypothetical protein VK558_09935 [Patescibacteria group bacterium]|nr:hypothetical protein [Patescibacteria group bacterium]